MIKKVKQYLTEYNMISEGDTITVGVSGGADSVCLLLNLIEYSKERPFKIKVVHINHLIRKEASNDADFVKELCNKHNIEYFLFEEPVENIAREEKISTEEAGRKVRYQRFNEVSSGGKIAVAHNSNDVAETVIFNMFRGTGLEGLASIEPVNGQIIRPLLGVSRKEIEQYLDNEGQTYVVDCTNNENDYARNKIRNIILPFAEDNIVTCATAHVAALSEKMRLVRHYIENQTRQCYLRVANEIEGDIEIDLRQFNNLDELMQQQVLLLALEKITSGRKDISEKHIEAILNITQLSGEKRVDLPYNLQAVKQYDRLYIRHNNDANNTQEYYVPIKSEGKYLINGAGEFSVRIFPYDCESVIVQNSYTKWFDYDKISTCPTVRTRRAGDYLTVNSSLSTKSLKDYFINEKIPREIRDKVLVVADDSHIMWVVGYRISEEYKVTDKTKTIIEISYDE